MLISEVIKELEVAQGKLGDVGVYVFDDGETLILKVEVLEQADMVVIRSKTIVEAERTE